MDKSVQTPFPQETPYAPRRAGKNSSPRNIWFLVGGLGIVALLVIGWIIFTRFVKNDNSKPSPSPTSDIFDQLEVNEESGKEDKSEEKADAIDVSEIKIEILNGTGIAREASYLRDKLASKGYEEIEVGNASSKDYDVAEVTFYGSFPDTLKKDFLDFIGELYTDVKDVDTSRESSVDVRITTGLRPGISRPTPTPEPEKSDDTEPEASKSATLRSAQS